ncbi:hypothetical protein BH09SUM1_BH09SUM1_16530 [soil metagenome]
MTAEWTILAVNIIASVAGLLCAFYSKRDPHKSLSAQAPWLLGSMLAPLFFLLIMSSHTWLLQGGDEYSRVDYGHRWMMDPFFAPEDHIWPSGHFWMLGIADWFFGSAQHAVTATSTMGFLAMALSAFFLGKVLWRSNRAGFFAAVLTATHYVSFWIGTNPMAEVFALPAMLGGMALWVAFWDDDRFDSVHRELKLLWAAALISFGCCFRYELWYLGIVLGAFMGFRMLFLVWRRQFDRAAVNAAGCATLLIFPLAWMISCKLALGSYIAFATTGTELNQATNLFYDLSSPLARFLLYPKSLFHDHWFILPIVTTGGLIMWIQARRRASVAFLAALFVLLLVSMLVTMKTGIGSNSPPRYTMFIVILLLSVAAGAFTPIWGMTKSKSRSLFYALAIGLLLYGATENMVVARRDYSHDWATHPATIAMLARLEREGDGNRYAYHDRRIQQPGFPLIVDCHDGNPTLLWEVRYYSQSPADVSWIQSIPHMQSTFATARSGSQILLRKPHPPSLVITHAELVLEMEGFEVWRQLPLKPAASTAQ